jgi:hypothetical protein
MCNAAFQFVNNSYLDGAEQLKIKMKQLASLQSRECPDLVEAIKKLQGEIDGIMEREDIKWKQRAKQNWYREGDWNTVFSCMGKSSEEN